MIRRRSLSMRMFVSYLAVVAAVVAVLFLTARLLGPALFGGDVDRLGLRYGWSGQSSPGGGGPGSGGSQGTGPGSGSGQGQAIISQLNGAYSHSLTIALLAAVGTGAVAAFAGAAVVSRRLLRPLDGVRRSVRNMAEGHYRDRIPEPRDAELADLSRDVNALGTALAETERHHAQLVSDLAHEIRTPITSLDGFLEGIEDGVFQPDPETIATMRQETKRLARLAADLGAMSRADEGAFDLQMAPADLAAVAEAVARSLAPGFAAAGVSLEVAPLQPMPVTADSDRLGQVVANLLRNALQHTPAGGSVRIFGLSAQGRASLTVSDNGTGIAPEDLPRIFDRFFRSQGPNGGGSGGTGIGLTIARAIARAHGGDIAAASEGLGKGASFTLTLAERRQTD